MEDWMQEALNDSAAEKSAAVNPPPAPLSSGEDWMNDALDDSQQERESSEATIIDFASRKNPEQYASDLKKSKQLDLNVEDVESNREEVTAFVTSIEARKAAQNSEAIRKAFEKPDFAVVAHDDTASLQKIEKTLKDIQAFGADLGKAAFDAGKAAPASRDDLRASFIAGQPGPAPKKQQAAQLAEQTRDFLPSVWGEIVDQFNLWDDVNSQAIAGIVQSSDAQSLLTFKHIKEMQSNQDVQRKYKEYQDSGGIFSSPNPALHPFARIVTPAFSASDTPGNRAQVGYEIPDYTEGTDLALAAKTFSPDFVEQKIKDLEAKLVSDIGTTKLITEQLRRKQELANPSKQGEIQQAIQGMVAPLAVSALPTPFAKAQGLTAAGKAAEKVYQTVVATGSMVPQIWGSAYVDMHDKVSAELSADSTLTDKQKQAIAHEKATESAIAHVIAESSTNLLSFGFLKSNQGVMAKLFAEPGIEGLGEGLNQAIIEVVDAGIVDPSETFDTIMASPEKRERFWQAVEDAIVIGAGTGLGITVISEAPAAGSKAASKAADKIAEKRAFKFASLPEPEIEVIGAFNPNRARPTTIDVNVQKNIDVAAATQEKIIGLGDAVKESKLHTRSPEHLDEFVRQAAGEDSVYIDIDEFTGYFQSAGDKELEAIIDTIPGLNDQIETALTNGGDIVIPVTEYTTKLAPTIYNVGFSEIARFRQADMSAAQAAEAKPEIQEQEEEVHNQMQLRESADMVHNQVRDQIVATGKFSASKAEADAVVATAFAKTMAKELGILPHQFYEKYAFKIQAAQTAKVMQQADKDAQAGKSVSGKEVDVNLLLQDSDGKLKLGAINFGRGVGTETTVISLLENANLSTVQHELSHYFFEVMLDIYKKNLASPSLKKDVESLLKFMGADSIEAWNAMSAKQKEVGHEKAAEAWEVYIMEGVAPSTGMLGYFQRMRDWMLEVYKAVKRHVNLTDEVRAVFDRMLASQQSIDAAKTARQYKAAFDSAEEAGWSEASWSQYQEAVTSMVAVAKDKLQTRLIKDMKWLEGAKNKKLAALQKEGAEKRSAIKEQVISEANELRVYKATKFFKTGELTRDGVTVIEPDHKLDPDILGQLYPPSAEGELAPTLDWKKLGYGDKGMLGKGGLHPDFIAPLLGYASGDALIQELVNTRPMEEVVEQVTDQRMLEQYGDILSKEALAAAANEALHNSLRAKVLSAEFAAIADVTGGKRMNAAAAKAYAKAEVGKKKVRDIKPNHYLNAEAAAAKKFGIAIQESDLNKAASSKLSQLLNHYLFMSANNAITEIEKARKYLSRFNKDSVRKKIDIEYIEQIDELLVSLDLRKGTSLPAIDKRASLADWIKQQEELGFQPILDERLVEDAKKTHYKNMTLNDLREIVSSVDHIEHLGLLKKKLLTSKDKREFDEQMEILGDSISGNANRTYTLSQRRTDKVGAAIYGLGTFGGAQRTVGSIVAEIDGQKDNGAMFNMYWAGLHEAGTYKAELVSNDNKEIARIFKARGRLEGVGFANLRTRAIQVPGTDISMTNENKIMLAVYWGSAEGQQRIESAGIDGTRGLTRKEVSAILDTLSKEDFALVQEIWKLNESKRPLIAEQEKRLSGVEPKWVDPVPFVTKHGVMPGGYHALQYDVALSKTSEEEAAMHVYGATKTHRHYATRHSYTETRAEKTTEKVLQLTFDTITHHLNMVNHRLAFQDWITDAQRILKAQTPLLRKHYGEHIINEIRALHQETLDGYSVAREHGGIQIANHLRTGTIVSSMAWNFAVAALQPTGLAISWETIGGKWMAKGIEKSLRNFHKSAEMIRNDSKYMKYRWESTFIREMNEELNKLRSGGEVPGIMLLTSFYVIARMQMMTDIPTWFGAYEKAIASLGLETAINEAHRKEIKEKAVLLADKAVEDSQGSGLEEKMARITKGGKAWRLFTMFGNYFVTVYNRNVLLYRRTQFSSPESLAKGIADLLLINAVPAALAVAMKELTVGDCDDSADWWGCVAKKFGKEQIGYMLGQLMFVREGAAAGQELLAGITDDKSYAYTGPAGTKWFGDLAKLAKQAGQGELDEGFLVAATKALGPLAKIPSAQIAKTIKGFNAWYEGDADARALVFGPKQKN